MKLHTNLPTDLCTAHQSHRLSLILPNMPPALLAAMSTLPKRMGMAHRVHLVPIPGLTTMRSALSQICSQEW